LKCLDTELHALRGYEVVMDTIVSEKPVRTEISFNLAVAGVGSLMLGVFPVFFLEWRANLVRPLHNTNTDEVKKQS
jgi:hypothetical protein